jgi:hypothetical protein
MVEVQRQQFKGLIPSGVLTYKVSNSVYACRQHLMSTREEAADLLHFTHCRHLAIDQRLKHGKLLFQLCNSLSPLNSALPVAVLLATSFAQVLVLVLGVLTGEFVVKVVTFWSRADPHIEWSNTAGTADGLVQGKQAIALSC